MATDDERRRVARKLREYASWDGEEDCFVDCADWGERVLNLLYRDGEDRTEGEYYARLADLIEPEPERTCRDVGDGVKFVCSECGASLDYEGRWDEPTFWVDDVAAAVEYCSNCGARVVVE